ncbi:penicillin-binding protein 1A [Rhodospirillum rubrum]|uniref:Penicillin-binding protein 1A n=1 Tax=Rhodospirillum rubrum (strain ATCC 11170 / ATH 1.1.1 / DSM 467 / LMG 4362 / NCIMB 8255 / S1) TaxID=269796 RepID=Q2RSE8_RHORT|nr:penicillin-binding protein 1A [Rhodospirillum rubrum]ABC22947.1 Penicillin-binding protein 1A [Rhodospirillum rubrum ATCC 11170]AEO48676.1 penicillin-binding protein 1A [Rhodospirillum rubrum F11]MBK5954570.1 penicillin-binding protein [Rhodospirillum rubrum]HAP99037.1 penicillin-binding protein 1A [Rhodospirillum rubrum]
MIRILLTLVMIGMVGGAGGTAYLLNSYGSDLPDYGALANYEPPITTRVLASDGRLMAEYAIEKRVYVPINAIPQKVKDAFLSAEDKNFYTHSGVDFVGLFRAVLTNLQNYGSGRRPVGASTITQQVAKNFLLTNEVSFDRKVKEAILAFRIEEAFSKDHILELYLNEIYLGFSSYGVAAAAVNYFNKSLDELTIGEVAFLAALPKAPNNYNPVRKNDAAKARRDWVVDRMVEDDHITQAEGEAAKAEPLEVRSRDETQLVRHADFFSEEVRRQLQSRYGEEALYKGGLYVRTTLDPRLQEIGARALRKGLIDYDRRHGWRGPVTRLENVQEWKARLAELPVPPGASTNWRLAAVLRLDAGEVKLGLPDGFGGAIPMKEMAWARPTLDGQRVGNAPKKPADVLKVGDVVLVEPLEKDDKGKAYAPGTYGLRQMPNVEGALVAMDPHTGRVMAMVGGFAPERSEFNRAIQAKRQPGSSFKPFVYLAALDHGYTPATIILDAPFVYDPGPGQPLWKPKNYSGQFYGPSTLRRGVEMSRNLMTVRLANAVGMDVVAEYAERFGVVHTMPRVLAASLGAVETTVMDMTTAYAMLVNGGRRIAPTLIDRIQDRTGTTVYRHDERPCDACKASQWAGQAVPAVVDNREIMTDPLSAYQIVSILQGVVQRGTGGKVQAVGKSVAGKTGTSNDSLDTWFVGFSPDLVCGVFVGFDEPKSLGSHEAGSTTAAPIFTTFMKEALADKPDIPFRVPEGIKFVRIDPQTGQRAGPGTSNAILEAFKPGSEPSLASSYVIDGSAPVGDYGAYYGGVGGEGATGVPGQAAPGFGAGGAPPQAGGLY